MRLQGIMAADGPVLRLRQVMPQVTRGAGDMGVAGTALHGLPSHLPVPAQTVAQQGRGGREQ